MKILFYDGDCGFCNKTVQIILKYEKNQEIYFSALQSDFAKKKLSEYKILSKELDTVIYLNNNQVFTKSTAALLVLKEMKFPLRLLAFFWIIPREVRDIVYRFAAKNRKRIVKSYCVMLNPEQSKRFLH